MKKTLVFVITLFAAVGLLVLVVLFIKGSQFAAMGKAAEEMVMPPISVSTFVAEKQTWTNELHSVGSIEPIQGVELEAEVAGVVESINFENGDLVEAGDLLIQLDVGVEKAQLKAAEASARLAEVEFERATRLRASGNVPQSDLDRAIASLEQASADVENIQAVIDRKTIRAPFAGRTGIRQINLGEYVAMGAPFVSLQSYDQVYVNFTLPQQALSRVSEGMTLLLESDVYGERTFEGQITAVSPQVDPATRTIELQGTLDNADGALRAGLFVRVSIVLPEQDEVVVVPATAVVHAPYGNSLFVIRQGKDGGTIATQTFVRTGRAVGDFISVTNGISAGETVVSAGMLKLFNGAPVVIDNEMAPAAELTPVPDNS